VSDKVLTPSVSWLVSFLLLCLREGDYYEHELARRMVDFGFGATGPGEVYRTLQQMKKEGMVVSERDGVDGGTSWRRYSITESGEAYLEFWANSLAQYQEEIDLFFRAYDERSVRGRGDRDGAY
jgi:poly-beta-hydroxybutyrate-responsive repressor